MNSEHKEEIMNQAMYCYNMALRLKKNVEGFYKNNGYNIPRESSPTSLKRQIVQLRQELLEVYKTL